MAADRHSSLRYEEKIRPSEASFPSVGASDRHTPQPTTDKTQVTNTYTVKGQHGEKEIRFVCEKTNLFYMDKIVFCKNVNVANRPIEIID